MAVLQAVPEAADRSDEEAATIARLAELMPADETQLLYSICLHGRTELGLAPDEYSALTMVLLRLLAFKPSAEKKTLSDSVGVPASPRPTQQPVPAARTDVPRPAQQPVPATRTDVARLAQQSVVPGRSVVSPPANPDTPRPTAPPGHVLPVVEPRQAPPRPSSQSRSTGDVMGVPVRMQPEPQRETPNAVPTVVPTPEGDFWQGVVQQLVEREAITALVRELALQAQLVGRDEGHWMLRVERESLNQPASRERLRAALHAAGHAVDLSVEVGPITDSPARRSAVAAAQRQHAAEQIIMNDPFVQQMQRDFGAKIVPGSIKPVEKH
jgi:DNA polymerase-3 subunit gamma/tau